MSNLFPMTIRNSFDRDLDNIFSSIFSAGRPARFSTVSTTPRANVIKQSEGYMIELAAPGFSREEFEISVDNGLLSIHAGASDTPDYSDSLVAQEYSYSSFTRSWSLPKEVSSELITARYDAGILYVTIPTQNTANSKHVISVE